MFCLAEPQSTKVTKRKLSLTRYNPLKYIHWKMSPERGRERKREVGRESEREKSTSRDSKERQTDRQTGEIV